MPGQTLPCPQHMTASGSACPPPSQSPRWPSSRSAASRTEAVAANGACPVSFYGRTGGMVPTPEEILAEIEKAVK